MELEGPDLLNALNATLAMSRLQELPSELLANIALFADWHCLWASDEKWADLLALRAASKPCKEAVRLSIKDHRACANIGFGGTNTRAIAAVGRVFGRGCAIADQSHIGDLFDLLESRCRGANIPPRFQIKLLV